MRTRMADVGAGPAPTIADPIPPMSQSPTEDEMHGEYKTPNGKLIAVDFAIAGGKLRDVMVTGDFFLYPEEALTDITGALEGLPADLSISEMAEQVRMAMPRDAELLGSSPDALATAVQRALAGEQDRPE